MRYPIRPAISKSQLNRYGDILRATNGTDEEAIRIVNSWRAAHLYPINTFRATLHKKTRKFGSAIIAQRLKRMETIVDKLSRKPEMELSRMQDIAGLRVILKDVGSVYALKDYYESGALPHQIKREDDYITSPKADGYRGIHMVFSYHGTNRTAQEYDGLLVELQIRTGLQHTWATAVELAGFMRGQKFKSDQGDPEWLHFFKLVSQMFELLEYFDKSSKGHIAPPNIDPNKLYAEITKIDKKHKILESIKAFSQAVSFIEENKRTRNAKYYIISMDPIEKKIDIRAYRNSDYDKALEKYAELEKQNLDTPKDQVLVSVGRINQLKQAYPNYFPDVSIFAMLVERAEAIAMSGGAL